MIICVEYLNCFSLFKVHKQSCGYKHGSIEIDVELFSSREMGGGASPMPI